MSAKRPSGLGRNLSALLAQPVSQVAASTPASHRQERTTCLINRLQPGKYQPRGDFDESSLTELAESIRKQGLIQPLVVREVAEGRYEIIAGERRWRACQQIGLTEVPVIVRQVDDETAMALALIENLQREDLNVVDQARAMQRLIEEFGLTHSQVAELLSKSRAAVSNCLRLLNLVPDVRRLLEYGDLDMGHARALLMLDAPQQMEVSQWIVARGLSVRETEALVARVKSGPSQVPPKPLAPKTLPAIVSEQVDALSRNLNTRVKLKHNVAGKGVLMIHYHDLQSLENMLARFEKDWSVT